MIHGQSVLETPATTSPSAGVPIADKSLRRFVTSISVAMVVVAIPYLFVLWDLWDGAVYPTRSVSPSNYYDLQAEAMAHGHLYLPASKLGVEAFFHDGHAYTYFGIFPSLLRAPFVLFFPSLFGHLTAPSLLLAWLVTGLFASMLLWRVRVLIRGSVTMGWNEAASCGLIVAAITGGSVLVYLAANPWVYDEDLAWSVALTLGCLFALLGRDGEANWVAGVRCWIVDPRRQPQPSV